METLTELKAKREAIDKQIAEMEAKEWPKVGDRYYTLGDSGVHECEWENDSLDKEIKNGLGVYRTEAESLTPDEKVIIGMQIDQEAKGRFHAYQLECKKKEIEILRNAIEFTKSIHHANEDTIKIQKEEIEELKKEIKRLTEKCSSEYWRGWNAYGESL